MDERMKMRYRLHKEKFSTQYLLDTFNNPFNDYMEEIIEGPIIDIGCGQSPYTLDFFREGRKIYAIDRESFQLELLQERVSEVVASNKGEVIYIVSEFSKDELPNQKFAVVLLSNILHFFSLEEANKRVEEILPLLNQGSFVLVQVHSTAHPYKKLGKKLIVNYGHFFTVEELNSLFLPRGFQLYYCAEVQQRDSKMGLDFLRESIRASCLEIDMITDEDYILQYQEENVEMNLFSCYIQVIYRKE